MTPRCCLCVSTAAACAAAIGEQAFQIVEEFLKQNAPREVNIPSVLRQPILNSVAGQPTTLK